jgi:LacI family transcriptional regulator
LFFLSLAAHAAILKQDIGSAPNRPTMNLEEVARLSGFSRSTVSRVINNDPNVSQTTREKVLTIVKQVNFQPNIVARSLAAGRTRILGLIIPRGVSELFTDPYFPTQIQGVASACNNNDYSVMLWVAEPEYERRKMSHFIHNHLIDGVIVSSMLMDDPVVQSLVDSTLPFVLIGRHPADARVSYVDVDNRSSTRDAVIHLLRLGHRRVGVVTGPQTMISGYDRLQGYYDGLRSRGIAIDPDLIVEGDYTETGGYTAAQRLLPRKPDSIFASSDAMAVGALRALREVGLRVPEDIAVVGFDDMPFASRSEPPLTTIRQPVYRMGVTAVEILLDLIENPDSSPRRIVLPTELVIRSTCGSGLA